MADDWETEADEENAPVVDKWEGEDVEEEVEESWDVDPEEVKKKQAAAAAARLAAQEKNKQNGPVLSERKKKQLAEAEKKQKEKEAEEAENDPKMKAQRKAEMEAQTRSRDARLAAQLLGVDLADANYLPSVSERDDGSDIAGGVSSLSVDEQQQLQKGGQSLDDFRFDDDVSLDKLATIIVQKCIGIQCNAKHSSRLLRFLKSLTNGICDPMKVDDVAELKRFITVKHNEVTQKQKTQQKGKKAANTVPGSKKANTVKVASSGSSASRNNYGDDLDHDDYDAGGDFM